MKCISQGNDHRHAVRYGKRKSENDTRGAMRGRSLLFKRPVARAVARRPEQVRMTSMRHLEANIGAVKRVPSREKDAVPCVEISRYENPTFDLAAISEQK